MTIHTPEDHDFRPCVEEEFCAQAWVDAVCRQPKFRLLLEPVNVTVAPHPHLMRVEGDCIHLDVVIGTYGKGAELVLRYAAELSLLIRLGYTNPAVRALMAARTASLATLGQHVFRRLLPDAFQWLHELETGPPGGPRASEIARELLALEGRQPAPLPPVHANCLLNRIWPVSGPVEDLIVRGGDKRLLCDPATGYNMYDCQPLPDEDCITFASCTATSISADAYFAVERYRQQLLAALHGENDERFWEYETAESQLSIATSLDLDPARTGVVLTPSGTDAYLQAMAIARAMASDRPISSILTAPNETGSGVIFAAAGRHFADSTALGHVVEKGQLVAGFESADISLSTIAIRAPSGEPSTVEVLQSEITARIEQERNRGRFVVFQALDVSKTGLVAPAVRGLLEIARRFPRDLLIVVDACQLRVSRETLNAYVDAGFLVMITASKFFAAPPFAGALLASHDMIRNLSDRAALPSGCGSYSTRADWPSTWPLAERLSGGVNIGLLMRWRAGLYEMERFARVPPDEQVMILGELQCAVTNLIARCDVLDPIDTPLRPHDDRRLACAWDEVQTIFAFRVRRGEMEAGASAFLNTAELKEMCSLLNRDISHRLAPHAPHDERRLAATRFHFGQPVKLDGDSDDAVSAIRIAFSARLVSEIWAGGDSGPRELHIRQAIGHVRAGIAKLCLIHRDGLLAPQRGSAG
jgi:hypothetical protein